MRVILSAAILACMSVPMAAHAEDVAQSAPTAKSGQAIFFSTGRRLGSVSRVMPNGDLRVIAEMKMVSVPAATLSMSDKRLVTSLTRAEIADQK